MKPKEELNKLIALHDILFSKVIHKLGVQISEDEYFCPILCDSDGVIDRYDSRSITIVETCGIVQVNLYGCGTLELQDEEGESLCWDEFPPDILEKVIIAISD